MMMMIMIMIIDDDDDDGGGDDDDDGGKWTDDAVAWWKLRTLLSTHSNVITCKVIFNWLSMNSSVRNLHKSLVSEAFT